MGNKEGLSLANIKNGAAIEAFDLVLQDVLINIQDPNTEAKDEREITLRVKFKPDEDRFLSATGIECWPSKVAKRRPILTQIAMDVDRDGVIEAKEIIPTQQSLFDGGTEKVHPIRKEL
ncbi:MAG: replication terminator protein [Deltaproteobacteria bacterium]|nr:replication terminator protein [Deltaproteobacteria bacterium]